MTLVFPPGPPKNVGVAPLCDTLTRRPETRIHGSMIPYLPQTNLQLVEDHTF